MCNNTNAINNPEKALFESSFKPFLDTIKALRTHDERLGDANLSTQDPNQNSQLKQSTFRAIGRR